jgi:hypothetical protein
MGRTCSRSCASATATTAALPSRCRRPLSARVPERDAPPDPGRRAHLEGVAHRERRGKAGRCAADARDRLALLRPVGATRRTPDPRTDRQSEFERFLARLVPQPRPDATDGGRAVRNAERVREAIRSAYRSAPDLDSVRGTRWGRVGGRDRLRRSRPADAGRRGGRRRRRASPARRSRSRSRTERWNY